MATTKKLNRKLTKEELREDRVATALNRFGHWAQRNRALVIGVAVAIVVVLVAAVTITRTRSRAENNASFAAYRAQTAFTAGNYAQALSEFQNVESQYGSTQAARHVQLFIGNCQLATGNPEAAASAFREYLGDTGKEPAFRSAAHRGLAAALLDQGNASEAADEYEAAALVEGNRMAADDWIAAGQAHLRAGETEKARSAFQRVVDEHPTHTRVQEAHVLLEEIEGI